jgi:hypothetical protein
MLVGSSKRRRACKQETKKAGDIRGTPPAS